MEGSLLRLTTLGATDLRDRDGQPIRELLAQPKRVALLVCLAIESRRGPVPRDRLLGLFWPESDETRARNTLSQALHHLRQLLGPDVIESHGATAVSLHGGAFWCDAVAFMDAIDRGEFEPALELYRGDLCPTLFVSGAPDVEQWLDAERRRMRGQALGAARSVATGCAGRGDLTGAARAARRALTLEPDDEADVRTFLSLLERAGDGTGALVAYQEFARRMAAAIEAEPAPETRALADAIRRRRVAAAREPAPAATDEPVIDRPAVNRPADDGNAAAGARATMVPARRVHRVPVVAGIAFVLLLVAGAVTVLGRGNTMPSTVKTIAVLPFALRGGAPIAYLHEGMVDLLSAKLGDAAGLQVIDPRSVVAAAGADSIRSPSAAAALARRLGAGWYISGDAIEVAGRLQLSGALYDVAAPAVPVVTGSVIGDTAALFELVDSLTRRMLAGTLGGRDTVFARLAAVTTQSLPALKAFLDGERALRGGRDAQAAEAYRTAASLDTNFALAQYRLALLATWVVVPDVEDPAVLAAKAARHADRLTPLGRDLLTAYRAYKEPRAEEAEQRYRAITKSHPDNVDAWLMLGEVGFHYNSARGRSPIEGRPAFQRALALDPANVHAIVHLARLAAWDGRVVELDSLSQRFRDRSRDAVRALELRGLQAYVRNDPEERGAIVAVARESDERVVSDLLQAALVYARNFDAAHELATPFNRIVHDSTARLTGRRSLTDLGIAEGRWNRGWLTSGLGVAVDGDWLLESSALAASDPAFALPRPQIAAIRDSVVARRRWPLLVRSKFAPAIDISAAFRAYLVGLLDARLGDTTAAMRAASALLATNDSARAVPVRQLGHALRAQLARNRGDLPGALSELQSFEFVFAAPWGWTIAHWGVRERFLMGEVLHDLGRDEEALAWYESYQSPYDVPWLALAQWREGQIHERLGHRERAAFHYERFVAMWRAADPEFQPMVTQAREAAARSGATGASRSGGAK